MDEKRAMTFYLMAILFSWWIIDFIARLTPAIEIQNSLIAKLLKTNIVLYPFVLYVGIPEKEIIKHEFAHVEQIKKYGFVFFYVSYLYFYIKNRLSGQNHMTAYLNIPYEIEARNLQKIP